MTGGRRDTVRRKSLSVTTRKTRDKTRARRVINGGGDLCEIDRRDQERDKARPRRKKKAAIPCFAEGDKHLWQFPGAPEINRRFVTREGGRGTGPCGAASAPQRGGALVLPKDVSGFGDCGSGRGDV